MKRSNWILLLLLALTIGAYFLLQTNSEKNAAEETPVAEANPLIPTQEGDVLKVVRIYDKNYNIVELTRDESGLWTITLPSPGEADQSLASAAETQIGDLTITTELGMVANFGDFGLDAPAYTIKLTYYSGAQHKIEVGDLTPTNSGYYVQLDDGEVYVVGQYGLDAVLKLIENPPYPPTPTPEASPTPTATTPAPTETTLSPETTPTP